ncbi:MAG: hypothetical protein JXJ04_05235 [Spirochaetales bacterium]|nr:hypothetical protein [Spirochaetales bacterium]
MMNIYGDPEIISEIAKTIISLGKVGIDHLLAYYKQTPNQDVKNGIVKGIFNKIAYHSRVITNEQEIIDALHSPEVYALAKEYLLAPEHSDKIWVRDVFNTYYSRKSPEVMETCIRLLEDHNSWVRRSAHSAKASTPDIKLLPYLL